MNLQISYGEAFDRLSILEIKQTQIQDPTKQAHIQRELQAYQHLQDLYQTSKYDLFYKLLRFVNQTIWDDTNLVKQLHVQDHNYAILAAKIFDYNQYRFRLKTLLHQVHQDNHIAQEQKSYATQSIVLQCDNINHDVFYAQLIAATLFFDQVELSTQSTYAFRFDPQIHAVLFPNISLTDKPGSNPNLMSHPPFHDLYHAIYLFYNQHLQPILHPMVYVAGGLLGDFVHQLSVIHETYQKTGRRGILYLSDQHGDKFRHGNNKAYQELAPLLQVQPYIHSFHRCETPPQHFDVNLSAWRQSPLLYKANWRTIFETLYKIPWASSPWLQLQLPPISYLQDKILVNHSLHRWGNAERYRQQLQSYDPSKIIFVGFQAEEYQTFLDKTQCSIPFYQCHDIFAMVHAIQSCKQFIGNLSSPLAIAYALHKPCITLLPHGCDGDKAHSYGLDNHVPFTQFLYP